MDSSQRGAGARERRAPGPWPLLVSAVMLALAVLAGASGVADLAPPVAADGSPIYWGAYIHGGEYDSAKIDDFEARAGKRLALYMFGQAWHVRGAYQPFPTWALQPIRDRGSIPIVDWFSWEMGAGVDQPDFQLRDIAAGAHDAYIRAWARDAKSWGQPFFIRLDAEMNGWWHPWSEQANGNAAGDFARAWRHIVDLFRQEGVTNVTWIWCPNVQGPASTPLPGLYPGDAYVDWVCVDGYNYGTDYGNKWHPFANIFKASSYNGYIDTYALLGQVAPTKPIMIGETASSEDGGDKAAWITDMLVTQLPTAFPRVQAFIWFNWNVDDPLKEWPIESSPASQAAFAAGIASPYYAANQFGALAASPIQPLGGPLPPVPTYTPAPVPTATPVPKAYRDEVLADGPVGYWRLGETSGTTAADAPGLRPGSYVGAPTLGVAGALAGDPDAATTFNGSSQYVAIPDASALSPQAGLAGALTLEAWVRLTALPSGAPGTVISKGAVSNYEYALRINPNGSVEIILWTPGGPTYQSAAAAAGTIAPGSWYHLVGTCENGVACRVYVNGTQRASVTSGWGSSLTGDTSSPVMIGRRGDGVQSLAGTVDEVAIYAQVLDPGRVQMHYLAGNTSTSVPATPTWTPAPPNATSTATPTATATAVTVAPSTATPLPTTCSPRPPVELITRGEGGRLRVTARATGTNNWLRELRFVDTNNATVEIGGVPHTGRFTVRTGSASQPVAFDVLRVRAGEAATVHIVAIDACGEWTTFVGGGRSSF